MRMNSFADHANFKAQSNLGEMAPKNLTATQDKNSPFALAYKKTPKASALGLGKTKGKLRGAPAPHGQKSTQAERQKG